MPTLNKIKTNCKRYGQHIVSSLCETNHNMVCETLGVLYEINKPEYKKLYAAGLVPQFALEDPEDDWWNSKECEDAKKQLLKAINELAPDNFVFCQHPENEKFLGFFRANNLKI